MRYFFGIVIGILIAAALYLGLFSLSLGKPNSKDPLIISEWYHFKENVAEKLPSPRLVIVSGSNALYGVRATRIEEKTGIPTANFATHAGLAADYILHRPKAILRPNDTVILALEYELYFPRGVNSVYSEYVLADDVDYFRSLSIKEQLIWAASAPLQTTVDRLKTSKSRNRRNLQQVKEMVAEEFNERGDITINSKADQTEAQRKHVENFKPSPTLLYGDWENASGQWAAIKEFIDWCHSRQIRVLATFPNTIYFSDYENGSLQKATSFLKEKYRSLGVPVLGEPRTFLYEPSDFFDTNYHLTSEGAEKRTDTLIDLLPPFLEEIKSKASQPDQ